MPTVALATCSTLPAGDEDGDALVRALADTGVSAWWRVWDDPAADWSQDLVVVRSTWDYTLDRDRFLTWTRGMTRLANPAHVIGWNSDKVYLRDLAEAGIPIVASSFAEPGQELHLPASAEFVVKPSVGAGSRGAARFAADQQDAARSHARQLHDAGRTVLLQPYLIDVDTAGETSLIYVGGVFSHAITKAAMLPVGAVNSLDAAAGRAADSLYVQEKIAARQASAEELAVGDLVTRELERRFGGQLLYARVDLLPTPDGPSIVELELTEPSLFLGFGDGAVARFAGAIADRT